MELAPAAIPVTPEPGLGCPGHLGIGRFVNWREGDIWQIWKDTDSLAGWKNGSPTLPAPQDSGRKPSRRQGAGRRYMIEFGFAL